MLRKPRKQRRGSLANHFERLESRQLLSADGIAGDLAPDVRLDPSDKPAIWSIESDVADTHGQAVVNPEPVVTVHLDALGRKDAVVQLLPGQLRTVESFQYDGESTRVSRYTQTVDLGDDGSIDSTTTTTYGYDQGALVAESTDYDADGNGVIDARSSLSYDAQGRVTASSYVEDTDRDGTLDARSSVTTEYRDRSTNSVSQRDEDGDGVDEQLTIDDTEFGAQGEWLAYTSTSWSGDKSVRIRQSYHYEDDRLVAVTASTDNQVDGTVDRIDRTGYNYDEHGTLVSHTHAIDDNADGVFESTEEYLVISVDWMVKDPIAFDGPASLNGPASLDDPASLGDPISLDDLIVRNDLVSADDPAVNPDDLIFYSTGGGLVGDLNGDGLVNGDDAQQLFAHWGSDSMGDLNGDGTVDAADADLLFANWTA